MADGSRILLVEDDPKDVELTLTALTENGVANEVVVVRDGQEALDYLYRQGSFQMRAEGDPVVVLLDLKLPKLDGHEVLQRVKTDEAMKDIPIVMLTSSREERDVARSYQTGANAYVVKPVDFNQFMAAINEIKLFWVVTNHPPRR